MKVLKLAVGMWSGLWDGGVLKSSQKVKTYLVGFWSWTCFYCNDKCYGSASHL